MKSQLLSKLLAAETGGRSLSCFCGIDRHGTKKVTPDPHLEFYTEIHFAYLQSCVDDAREDFICAGLGHCAGEGGGGRGVIQSLPLGKFLLLSSITLSTSVCMCVWLLERLLTYKDSSSSSSWRGGSGGLTGGSSGSTGERGCRLAMHHCLSCSGTTNYQRCYCDKTVYPEVLRAIRRGEEQIKLMVCRHSCPMVLWDIAGPNRGSLASSPPIPEPTRRALLGAIQVLVKQVR